MLVLCTILTILLHHDIWFGNVLTDAPFLVAPLLRGRPQRIVHNIFLLLLL